MEDNNYTLLSQQLTSMTTLMNAQFINVHERLDKINGKVLKHDEAITDLEKQELTHITRCPNVTAIRALQDESLSNKSVKKFMGVMFVSGIAIGGFIIGVVELILK